MIMHAIIPGTKMASKMAVVSELRLTETLTLASFVLLDVPKCNEILKNIMTIDVMPLFANSIDIHCLI